MTTSPSPAVARGPAVPLPTDRPATANEAVASAPSAIRLTNIEGAMLLYYAQNRQLPSVLDELKSLGDDVQLTSPESGQPYAYSRDGLLTAGNGKRIIVWDPVPGHDGKRWCILMPRLAPNSRCHWNW